MIEANVKQFFATALERYEILQRRLAGHPKPYSEDPIFQAWRFCNTFREDDKTTVWFRQNVRGLLQHRKEDVIRATLGCRWFNRISTWELLQKEDPELLLTWETERVRKVLQGVSPVVTGAYVIMTPKGFSKLDGILFCLDVIKPDIPHLAAHLDDETTCEGFWTVLQEYPCMGGFMAYQIVSDLLHTDVLRNAPDRMTWCCPGPGSARGVGWLVAGYPELYSRSSQAAVGEMLGHMRELLALSREERYWSQSLPAWDMQCIQHWACDFDKYKRAETGQDQKRRFS